MSMYRRLTTMLLVVPVAALGLLLGSPAAFAADGPAATQLHQGMNVVGFDAAVARAHGYQIVTYANGDQQAVPADPASRLAKSPIVHHSAGRYAAASNYDYDRREGNCGVAWISVTQTGIGKVQLASGFTVYSPAIDYDWMISLTDAVATSHQEQGGSLFFRTSWAHTWTNLTQHTKTFDYISSGIATLDSGAICFADRATVAIKDLGW